MASNAPLEACWLDQSIGETNSHVELKQRFQGVSDRIAKWHYFDNGDSFNAFIDANPNANLVVIMAGRFAKTLLPLVTNRDVLHSVYVFCGNKQKYQTLPLEDNKIKGVFTTEDDLFRQMRHDL